MLIGIAVAAFLFAPLQLYMQQERIEQLQSHVEQPRRARLVLKEEAAAPLYGCVTVRKVGNWGCMWNRPRQGAE